MMGKNNKAYLIPDNPQPEDFYRLCIFIPRDETYLAEFSGAFQFFGKWLAWEKDPTNRAALAATAWKIAIEKTFDEGWLNCGEDMADCCEEIEEIIVRLEELENMNINVNCGCGCGSSTVTCLPIGDITPPPGTIWPNPITDPTPTPEDELGLLWKCNMSHYIIYMLRLWAIQATANNGVTLITQSVNDIYDGLGINRPNQAHLYIVAAVSTMLSLTLEPDQITIPYDANYDYLVCRVYGAATDEEAYDRLEAALNEIMPYPASAMLPLLGLLPFTLAFNPQEDFTHLPPSYQERDCTFCNTPAPPGGGLWEFVNNTLSAPFPDVINNAPTDVEFTGTASTESSSTLSAWARMLGFEEISVLDTIQAVAFTVAAISMDGTFTPDNSNGLFFGGTNTKTQLLGVVSAGETVLVYRTGYTQPDEGTFDHVFAYNSSTYFTPQFSVSRFTYHPPDTNFTIETDGFEIRYIS